MEERAAPGHPHLVVASDPALLAKDLELAGLKTAAPVVVLVGGAAGLSGELAGPVGTIVRESVVATAAEAGAIVVDGGTDSGVMALAGQARTEMRVDLPLVGVAPIGKVGAEGVTGAVGTAQVEPNHSHVILVPGDEWGAESPWLIAIARVLSGGLPIAAVLINGGPLALAEAVECAARGWPVIVVDGTGRSADTLAAYARTAGKAGRERSADTVHVVQLKDGPAAVAAALALALGRASPPDAAQPNTAAPPREVTYPALYTAASEASKRAHRLHLRLSRLELAATSIGIALALIVGNVLGLPVVVAVSAFSFLAALVLKLINRASGFEAEWYDGRALAETVKGLSWRYMMRVPPYGGDNADARLRADLALLLRRRVKLRATADRLADQPSQITDEMRALRALEFGPRRDYYLDARLLEQSRWYRRNSASAARAGRWWFWVTIAFQLAAAAVALAAITFGVDIMRVVSLLGAIALALAAWSQLSRYDELSSAYGLAMQQLLLIAAAAPDISSASELDELVTQSEECIAREHRLWVSRRPDAMEAGGEPDDGGD